MPLFSGTTNHFHDIFFTDENHGWAVGDAGLILATSDGGGTWTQEPSSTSSELRGVVFRGGVGYAVGVDGTIIKRTVSVARRRAVRIP